MKFQLVIPMSGIGLRFINKGYKVPKPLIEINGKPIINHVFNIFKNVESVVFICNENHLKDKELNMMMTLKEIHPKSTVVSIKPHKKGPIFAVLQALEFINLRLPTIVNYCDFFCLFNSNACCNVNSFAFTSAFKSSLNVSILAALYGLFSNLVRQLFSMISN